MDEPWRGHLAFVSCVAGIPRLRGGKLVPAIRGRDALATKDATQVSAIYRLMRG